MAKKAAKADMTTELLRGLSDISERSSIPLVDPSINTAPFTSRHSSNIGMMNEGMGNIINTLDGVADRENQVVARRNQQASAMRDQGIADRKALMDFAIKREGIEYDREQDAITNDREAAKIEAELNSPTNKLNAYKLQQAQESAAKTKQKETFLSTALQNAIDPSDDAALVELGRSLNIPNVKLGDLIGQYNQKYENAVGEDKAWEETQTKATENLLRDYEKTVYTPAMNTFNNELMNNNLSLSAVQSLASGEVNFVSGKTADIVKTFIEGEDKGLFSPNDMEDITGFLQDAQKISGDLGVDVNLAKDAILLATGGTYTFGRTDTVKEEALGHYKAALKAKGFGTSELAKANRASNAKMVNAYNKIQEHKQLFEKDVAEATAKGNTAHHKGRVTQAYTGSPKVKSVPTFAPDSEEYGRIRSQYFPQVEDANSKAKLKAQAEIALMLAELIKKRQEAKFAEEQQNNEYMSAIIARRDAGTASLAELLMLQAHMDATASSEPESVTPSPRTILDETRDRMAEQRKRLKELQNSRK